MMNLMYKSKYHKMLSLFLVLCLAISLNNVPVVSAYAATGTVASDAAIDLTTLNAGAELASGVYYLSESKTFGSTSTLNNGLKIKSGATVYIYVPEGVTLTAIGGGTNEVRQSGGYAGILLPSGSTLVIIGEGNVVATGGRAGNGASGSSGGGGYVSSGNKYYAGYGGAGGAGGGGAGAGIGTNGGKGGSGGSQKANNGTGYDGDSGVAANNGNSGSQGGTAASCGTLYVQNSITLNATGGAAGTSGGSGGGSGSCDYSSSKWDGKKYHVAGGGGGGGGGGAGYSAYGIGTGGAAGGGGGSGGSGAADYTEDNNHDGPVTNASCNGAGGSSGSGYYSGSSGYGTRDTGSYDGSWKKEGGTGGSGGSTGSGSTSRTVFSSGWINKTFKVSFTGGNGETVQQFTYTFGEETTTITVPDYPYIPEDGYRFSGWSISSYGVYPAGGTRLAGTDTKVYQPGERIEAGAWLSGSIVLKPVISEIDCKVYFNHNGGSGSTSEMLLKSDMTIQPSVTVPTREGYDFLGYYTGMVKGTQYYDATGAKIYNKAIADGLSKVNLYAQWSIHSSTLTIEPNGGQFDGNTTFTKTYKESVMIKDPTDTSEQGKNFLRWALFETGTNNISNNGKLSTGAGYTTFTFGPDTQDVTLKAIWSGPNDTRVEVNENVTQEISCENLDRIFLHVATDPEKGLTAEEALAEKKEVVLTVENIAVNTRNNDLTVTESVQAIESVLENSTFESLSYYDISVNKIISDDNGDKKEEKLKELPEVIAITIDLTEELAGKSGYSVYRVHEGVAERMSSSRSSEEYYEVSSDSITIYTKKFSTYAITASRSTIGEWSEADLDDTNNSASTDVQGKYVDSTSTRVYKVDVEWGAMQFVFNKHQKWNPEEHTYHDEISIFLDESAYVDGNNQIVVTNHSNADVRVGMSVQEQNLDGIDIFLKQQNDDTSDEAVDMYLRRVSDASGNGTVSSVNSFIRLGSGTLTESAYEALTADGKVNNFQQIAKVVITIEAVTNSETTPLYFGGGN